MSNDSAKIRYEGEHADVVWDERLCIHVGECGRAANELFVGGRKPWCQPDLVPMDEVIEVVSRCPSGALSVERKDGRSADEEAPGENVVQVSSDGPLYLRGELEIDAAGGDQPSLGRRAALCRCGASKNKPFCDGAHIEAGFRDYGAVGEKGDLDGSDPGGAPKSEPLEVKRIQNGPLYVRGPFSILASSGRVAWSGEKAALCRCGASKNKPFCDGQHAEIGFEAE